MSESRVSVIEPFGTSAGMGPSLEALPLALVGLLERRHLQRLNVDEWHFSLEAERSPRPILQRLTSLPRDSVPLEVLAQAFGAAGDLGHASVTVLDAAPSQVSLYMGLRRDPDLAEISTEDALTGQSAALAANMPGLALLPAQHMILEREPELCRFIDQAACLAPLTGTVRPRGAGSSAGLERLIRAGGDGRFVMMLIAQPQRPALIDAMLDTMRRLRSEIHSYTRRTRTFNTSTSQTQSSTTGGRAPEDISQMPMMYLALSTALKLGAVAIGSHGLRALADPLVTLAMIANQRSFAYMSSGSTTQATTRATTEGGSLELMDANAQACEQILLRHEERLIQGKAQGYWRTAVYLAADQEATLKRVSSALLAMAIGPGVATDPIKMTYAPRGIIRDAMRGAQFIRVEPKRSTSAESASADLTLDSLSTLLTTEELALLAALPAGEVAGIARQGRASFALSAPSLKAGGPTLGKLLDERGLGVGEVAIDAAALNRNTLVTGIVGSGKSTTCQRLLAEAHRTLGIPFLVVEPVKTEYRRLAEAPGLAGLDVYTIGDSFGKPLRLNPLEPVPGFPVARHIDMLKAVFNATFAMFPGGSQVLEEALIEVYVDRGWSLRSDEDPRVQFGATALEGAVLMPNLQDLVIKIDAVVNRKRYSGEVQSNIRTALQQRVEGLLLGQKAAVFDTRRSTPVAELLGRPAVVELQTLGDDDEKAFVMALLFALLAQHAEIRQRGLAPSAQRKLQHLTLIEEAHRLLSAVRPSAAETADPRGKAVSMFADLLAELRAYGEGFIIADQIPTKLAPETMKNTAVKIVHRLTAADDRQAMSACMDLSADQNRHLNRLAAGQAVFHDPSVGDALLIAVTPLERAAAAAARPQGGAARLSAQHYLRRGSGCEQCSSPCRWYGAVSENESPARAAVGTLALRADIEAVVSALLATAPEAPPPAEDLWREEDAGWRYCASLFVARAHLRDRALVRCRAVGLSTLRARDMIDIERATTALGPVLLARVRAEAVSGSTWRSAADTLRVALAAVPPREWPGCAQCSVRCRALPIVAGHKDRAGALLALPRADQSAALRVDAFLTQAKKVPSLDAGALWCLAVQAVGEHFYEVNARSFMVVLREALR